MSAETILTGLVRLNLAASVAILLVLFLRPLALRWRGASIAYWLWIVVPIAAASSLLPAREKVVLAWLPADVAAARAMTTDSLANALPAPQRPRARAVAPPLVAIPALGDLLIAAWLLGAGALLFRSIGSTRRLAADPSIGPALVGVLRPKLVLPADFETRFDAQERALVLAHEEVHRISGHTLVNALVEVARCASWFNPVVHLAARRIRTDQELACDATVIAAHPTERRAYAQALLKTQIAPGFLPLGCTWTSGSAKRLRERIAMVGRPSLNRRSAAAGAAGVAVLSIASGYAVWAQLPERVVTRIASADAPDGVLAPIERLRHDRALEKAQAGNIDVVFFGDSDMEFWLWQNRGASVWKTAFASYRAEDFGSQGATIRSTLWRMQHGELDGYRAKLIVMNVHGPGELDRSTLAEAIEGESALLAEIRNRQPQAKVVLFANFRAALITSLVTLNTAVAGLADNQNVFFVDINDRFVTPGGSLNPELWSTGMRTPGYVVWAEEIQPWLERFVR